MNNGIKLSARLEACASLVNDGTRLADVGCDHGYVPVSLVMSGRIKSAVACDINKAPLASCRRLVSEYGLEDKIKCVLSDGLDGVDGEEVDDVLFAGMGGELIAALLDKCQYINKKHVIINAMTHPELARKWLFEHGFEIQNDLVVPDGRHHYSVLDAVYTGKVKDFELWELYLGKIRDFSDREFFEHLLVYLKNKQKSGVDLSAVITKIEEKL
ncbi:MAG: SAM-dependent methyltransferase [Eubacterium sp.]|nr:SAM-dependent methyltransferase [Eubacterium sp.]